MQKLPSISAFYSGKSVLVTGFTGFLGKIIVEKILRSCPEVEAVYLLVRPDKTKSAQQRVKEVLEVQLFDLLRKEQPNFQDKVRVVASDLGLPDLGISDAAVMEEIRREVSIIIHSAASVNFFEPLDQSLIANVLPVKSLLDLAKSLARLDSFVYISTAYSQCDKSFIEEKFYDSSVDTLDFTKKVLSMDKKEVEAMSKSAIGKRPNTYTFTKSLAETLIKLEGRGLPIAVVRPSIISSTMKSPFPGWIDNSSALLGLHLCISHGALQCFPGDPNALVDVVPADFCANVIIAASCKVGCIKSESPMVFNCTSSGTVPLTVGENIEISMKAISKSPLNPLLQGKHHFPLVSKKEFFSELSQLTKNPSLDPSSLKMARRLQVYLAGFAEGYSHFSLNEFRWEDGNVKRMIREMHPADRETFSVDLRGLDWEEYLPLSYEGGKYLGPSHFSSLALALALRTTPDLFQASRL